MEKKYEVQYHVNTDGSMEVLCELLDCFEQPCYYKYKEISGSNPWIFFCGNTNLHFIKGDEPQILVSHSAVRAQHCIFKHYRLKERFSTEISNMLRAYGEVIVSTAFNYVKDYVWYSEKGLHINHCFYLIGEDNKNYFVVDSPTVLFHADELRWDSNNSIFNIPKEHFKEAFQKYCEITTIEYRDIPSTKKDELIFFKAVCGEICNDYENRCANGNHLMGRQALQALKDELIKGNEDIMKDVYMYHLMLSRRIVLKKCFHIFQTDVPYGETINDLLMESVKNWKKMKDLSFESHYYGKNVCELAVKEVEKILGLEDILIQEIVKGL